MLSTGSPAQLQSQMQTPLSNRLKKTALNSKASDPNFSAIVDEFDSAYWSGIDASIFFNDMFIDDIINIQYQITENVMPIYGYGDYVLRATARGSRIIQGSFSINFKRSFYVLKVLNMLIEEQNVSPAANPQETNKLSNSLSMPTTPEELLGLARSDIDGGLDLNVLTQIRNRNINKFWSTQDTSLLPKYRRSNIPLYSSGPDGFTLYIKYGNPPLASNTTTTFGSNGASIPLNSAGTIEALSGVQITGASKAVDDSGRNIIEVYSFLASDLIPETGYLPLNG
jgi:hypothetical protein